METVEQPIDGQGTPAGAAANAHADKSHPSSLWLAAAKLLAIGALIIGVLAVRTGMLTAHMAGHIIVMNLAAPAIAWLFRTRLASLAGGAHPARQLLLATLLQLAIFFLWHSPPAMAAAMHSAPLGLAMLAILFAVAVWFWTCIFETVRQDRMEAIAALLVTGKLVCLIAVLLVFAPRLIYPGMAMHTAAMGDQQLAGLLMLSACPLTYVGASIYVIARWFSRLSSQPASDGPGI